MPRSRMELNTMLSWRGTTDGAGVVGTDFGELLILLLLGDSRIAKGASPKTALPPARCSLYCCRTRRPWRGMPTVMDLDFLPDMGRMNG